ncbi:ABC transporter ATP-binding protein [Staphylococcus casei]|uniref:ABC transporter ATP-binding protein n=1 Tax=Staphylococcus casei TaxID=201828 RepID=A0ABZ2WEY6_9STAP
MLQNNNLLFLVKQIKWPKPLFIIAIFTISLGSISELIVPLLTGQFIDKLVTGGIQYRFLVLLGVLFIVDAVLNGIGLYLLIKVGEKIIYSLRSLLWEHIIYLNIPFFDRNENGELISRLTEDTSLINNFISQKFPSIVPGLLTLIGSLFMLFVIDWKMTLLTFITIPVFILVIIPLSNIVENISQSTQLEIAKFTGVLGRVLSAIRLVKVSNTESEEVLRANKKLDNIYKLNIKHAKITAILEPFSSILLLIMLGVILGFGGYRIATGAITSGQLVTMIFYVIQLSAPISTLSTLITDYKNAKGASRRISEILKEEKENYTLLNFKNKPVETLTFNSVYFSYDNKYVLKNVSFTIPKGSTTAIVGPSGSGKTTLFNLITRMYTIDSGTIHSNGDSIYDFSLSEWRNNIGYVMQNNSIISGTIKSNILYGTKKNISQKTIDKYARLSNSYEFIMGLNKNYDFEVGEAGGRLSGGQKQRIDITRNLIKNPDLLLLDEATASLDSESEKKVQHALEYLSHTRTTIIIAHRLSTIKKADQILFLDDGKITGTGNHEELMYTHNKYYKFVMNQSLN